MKVKWFLLGVLLIIVLSFVIPLSSKASITVIFEKWDDSYYQTTTWQESDIYHHRDGLNQTHWYAEGSISPFVPPEEYFAIKFANRSFEGYEERGYVEIYLDGRHGNGVVWLEKKISINYIAAFEMRIFIFSEYDNSIQNWPIYLYSGDQDPDNETILRDSKGQGIQGLFYKEGILNGYIHKHIFAEPIREPTILYLAFGIGIASEENRTYYVSDVAYDVYPIPQSPQVPQSTSGLLFLGTLISLVAVCIIYSVRKKNLSRISNK